ncbi:uncharacterized protein LOC120554009 [Perca fluviatilis]|uniref:uncharacterized protein LOC120554009 n=1 Tax=Perca fluviatilis TaxID=8168 RepID=UPI001962D698|nr:uncharacterized protein LOC120554009 [Perca fluviatilis]
MMMMTTATLPRKTNGHPGGVRQKTKRQTRRRTEKKTATEKEGAMPAHDAAGEEDYDATDNRQRAKRAREEQDEEQDEQDEEESERFVSKNGEIEWSSTTYHPRRPRPRRHAAEYEEEEEDQQLDDERQQHDQDGDDEEQQQAPESPGPTEYATTRVRDILSTFDLLVTRRILEIAVTATNLEGPRKCGNDWKMTDATELRGYLGLLLLAGVYRSRNEALESLWHEESGRAIFRATMSLKRFHALSRLLRFDDRETRGARRASDKLAAITRRWDACAARLASASTTRPRRDCGRAAGSLRGECRRRSGNSLAIGGGAQLKAAGDG